MRNLLFFTVITLPISITLHHGLVALSALVAIYSVLIKSKSPGKTLLLNPIHLFNLATVASAVLYMPEKIRVALSSSFLRYSYIAPFLADFNRSFFMRINSVLVLEGLILIPVFLYNLYFNDKLKLLWGNMFKIVEMYSLFFLAAITLALYKRSWFYWALSLIFLVVILVPARRSETLGLMLTVFLIMFVYLRYHKTYVKYALGIMLALIITAAGGFIYMVEVRQDYRFVTLVKVIKGEAELNDKTLNAISTTRWGNLKNALEVIRKDIEGKNWVPLLIGHGIYSAQKLNPPPYTKGLTFYESIVFVQEFIQRGVLGVLAMLFIFYRSIKFLLKLDMGDTTNVLLIPLAGYLVFYNLSTFFTPYVNSTYPVALLMFGIAESYLRRSPNPKK
ncbi:hypothetical protein [Hydrogenivirga sp.]